MNGAEMFGQDSELMFHGDLLTKRMVIQLVNAKTKEVVLQVPPEYVWRLAQDVKPPAGSQS